MKKSILVLLLGLSFLISCNSDQKVLDTLNEYNLSQEEKGYHFGDKIQLPSEVLERAEHISISFGEKKLDKLEISPEYFSLGDNNVTFEITTKSGKVLTQDANINVYAKTPEKSISYKIVAEYPHNPNGFTQGFQLDGNTIYESDGQTGESRVLKYNLGTTEPIATTHLEDEYFGEGATLVGDTLYQLTWQHKKGFIYDKATLKPLGEYAYPNSIGEGWGLTYDGKDMIFSDGTKNIYFINPKDPSTIVRQIGVANTNSTYDDLNELEYYNGFIYANVWQTPYIIKINPKTGESVGKIDLSEIVKKHTKGSDDVLNGIAIKGNNLLVTGKTWDKIYEIEITEK